MCCAIAASVVDLHLSCNYNRLYDIIVLQKQNAKQKFETSSGVL